MQTKDFKGQDLRGQSFKNQDLTGADFSDCDLRGVDFSFANLTDAKFCNSRLGRTKIINFVSWLLQLGLSVATITITTIASAMLIGILGVEDKNWLVSGLLLISIHILLAAAFLFSSLKQQWSYLFAGFGASTIVLIIKEVVKVNSISKIDNYNLVKAMVNADAVSGVLLEIGTTIGISIGALIGISIGIFIESESIKTYRNIIKSIINTIVSGIFIGIIFMQLLSVLYFHLGNEKIFSFDVIFLVFMCSISIGVFSLVYLLLGIYLGKRANNREEFQLLWLHKFSLKIACFGSTKFEFSILKNTDFSETNLAYANFKNSKIISCYFQNTRNHHLALFENTPLEPRKVRDLVIDGIITDKNFATLDLRGLDFSHLNLQDFDFGHANLSGANLSHTQLTGAILEGWNIDTETNLEGVNCRYYYFEKVKDDDSEEEKNKKRMPSNRDYIEGEFTQIFKKVADVISVIAHNETQLTAIKLSVAQIREDENNDEIYIQGYDDKDGVRIVRISLPKYADKGFWHNKIDNLKTEYEVKIQQLMNEDFVKIGKIESLEKQLKEQRQEVYEELKQRNITTITIGNGNIIGKLVVAENIHDSFNSQEITK